MQSNSRPLPAHQALLWACAASYSDAEAQSAIERALTPSIDWAACARASIRHGVASLAAHRLADCSESAPIPHDVRACFARMLRANEQRNRVMFRECARLIGRFEDAGIPCLILKGVGLALSVYADPALRNFADIDLMVAETDLEAACALASAAGFAPEYEEADSCLLHRTCVTCCPEDILTDTLPLEYEPNLSHEVIARHRHRVVVEIHRGLFRDASGIARHVDNTPLWHSPQSVRLPGGTTALTPSPEVMLVHLCDHAAGHGYARLIFFVDLALVLEQSASTIDWDRVIDLAVRYNAEGRAYRCLEFVRREFGAPVPQQALQGLARSARLRSIRPLQPADIFAGECEFGPSIGLQGLLQSQNLRQFATALRHIVAPPPVLMRRYYRVRHPVALALRYIWRPFLLIGHLAQALVRRARRRKAIAE